MTITKEEMRNTLRMVSEKEATIVNHVKALKENMEKTFNGYLFLVNGDVPSYDADIVSIYETNMQDRLRLLTEYTDEIQLMLHKKQDIINNQNKKCTAIVTHQHKGDANIDCYTYCVGNNATSVDEWLKMLGVDQSETADTFTIHTGVYHIVTAQVSSFNNEFLYYKKIGDADLRDITVSVYSEDSNGACTELKVVPFGFDLTEIKGEKND